MARKLAEYDAKRDFAATPEPPLEVDRRGLARRGAAPRRPGEDRDRPSLLADEEPAGFEARQDLVLQPAVG